MASATHRLCLMLLVACSAGCNLTLDIGDYPYQATERPRGGDVSVGDAADTGLFDTSASDASADVQADIVDTADVQPDTAVGKPYLIFTELMPDTSTPSGEANELGEYIEVKNVGTAPADPRRIIIGLGGSNRRIQVNVFPLDPDGQQVLSRLRPIAPGHYFVFVREDSDYYKLTADLKDGAVYEYGRWSDSVPLSNSSRRLVLSYREAEFQLVEHDAIEWSAHALIDPTGSSQATLPVREDVAWGVQAEYEDADGNDDPLHWCYHVDALAGSPVKASPGAPTPANCSRD